MGSLWGSSAKSNETLAEGRGGRTAGKTKKRRWCPTFPVSELSAQTKGGNHLLVALIFGPRQVIEQFAAASHEAKKSAA